MSSYRIAIVGEAYGEQEEIYRKPFIGSAGMELDRILADADIRREDCYLTNVFNLRPEGNRITSLCGAKRDPAISKKPFGSVPLDIGKYLLSEFEGEVDRLHSELAELRPNVTVALGNTACWALLGTTRISKIRGAVAASPFIPGLKILPTYHPAAILRQYKLRAVTVLDFAKAKRESEFPQVIRPNREIWLDPDIEDIARFYNDHIRRCEELAVDVETKLGQITCISFAPSPDRVLVVPFVDYRKPGNHYWPTLEAEIAAWDRVAQILSSPCKKVGQNFLYDMFYIWRTYGIPVRNYDGDTMLLHHSMQPEAKKSLDFLGSVYTNEAAWKTHRPKGTIKRED